jgi:hypothetical protein
MRFVPSALCVLLSGFGLVSCVDPVAPVKTGSGGEVSENLADAKMPLLRSAYFEREWGKPHVAVNGDGSYMLRYRQGTTLNYVFIHGLPSMEPVPANPPAWTEAHEDESAAPPPHEQSWKQTKILGQPVKWYKNDDGSGADFPCYKTVDFTLTAPDGRAGFYRVEVCTDSPTKAADWIHRVGW